MTDTSVRVLGKEHSMKTQKALLGASRRPAMENGENQSQKHTHLDLQAHTQPIHHLHRPGSSREPLALGPRSRRGRVPVPRPVSFPCDGSKGPKGTHNKPLNLELGKTGAHVAKEEQGCAEGKLWLCEFFF